jgi:2'-5' RNA ligase
MFIALTPPPAWRREIESIQNHYHRSLSETLTREQLRACRWVAPEKIHLTLLFLGDVRGEHVATLQKIIQGIAAECAAFELHAGRLGFFPNRGAPRVLWLGLKDSEPLRELHSSLTRGLLKQRGVLCPDSDAKSFDTDKFAPHLTLARIKVSGGKACDHRISNSLHKSAEDVAVAITSRWSVESLELLQSKLSPQGSEYSTRGQHQLKVS